MTAENNEKGVVGASWRRLKNVLDGGVRRRALPTERSNATRATEQTPIISQAAPKTLFMESGLPGAYREKMLINAEAKRAARNR